MDICNVILDSSNEHEIYFLLTSYIQTLRYRRRLDPLPRRVMTLPLNDLDDVRVRFIALAVPLADTSFPLDVRTRPALQEAARVFGAALHRLSALKMEESAALPLATAA